MSAIGAIAAGFRRALGSPLVLLWLWLVTVVVALPATWVVTRSIEDGIGSSRVHETLRDGFDYEWYRDVNGRARGIARTFDPTATGRTAFLDNLEDWLTGDLFRRERALLGLGAIHGLLWLLMLGGALDRYANREEQAGIKRFFATGGKFFFRLLRLCVISAGLYASIYLISRRLFDKLDEVTRDVTVEGTVVVYSVLAWALVAFMLLLVHMSFGYAKVATVVENRRSMLLAALRGVVFVATHPLRAFGHYYGVLVFSGLVLGLYAFVAPGVDQSVSGTILRAFLFSQLFLLARLALRLSLLAGQTALYQGYARPAPASDASGATHAHDG